MAQQPKGAGQSSGEVAAVALLREIFPPADLATYDGEPDDVERSQWVTNGARRRISALLSGTATDKSNHKPECWGRTSFSDEVAHCYCATDNADGLSADRERIIAGLREVQNDMTPSQLERCDSDGHAKRIEAAIAYLAAPAGQDLAAVSEALQGAIQWDKERGYRMPYRVRDPLYAALAALKDRA